MIIPIPACDPEGSAVKITVVIPTYNRAKLLSRAIGSIQQQTYTNWKLIIADNASSDSTASVVSEAMRVDSRIGYYRHANNIGMLANWAFAISKVETDYFCILCDDDIVLPDFFLLASTEMSRLPEIGLCFGFTAALNEHGACIGAAPTGMATGQYPKGFGALAMVSAQHPASTATLFRSASVQDCGGFDVKSHYAADLDMMLRVSLKYPIKFFGEEVAFHVIHGESSFKNELSWYPGLLNLIRNLKEIKLSNYSHRDATLRTIGARIIVPSLANMIVKFFRHPVRITKSSELRHAIQCLHEIHYFARALLILPFCIARRCASLMLRTLRLRSWFFNKAGNVVKRHPRADGYFTVD